ncbi:hypothetical protein SESBI_49421 [Sesbania bispinosa]|nr:hypothetical protein SESBI_49421 [Sesbania bispinosa]
MENQSSNSIRSAVEHELIRGRDIANQLLEVFVHKSNTQRGDVEGLVLPFAEDLVRKVLKSFTNTLLLLSTNNDVSHEVVPITATNFSSSVICPKPKETDEVCKKYRGHYKRK